MIDNKHKFTNKILELLTYKRRRTVHISKLAFVDEYSQSPDFQPVFFLSTGRCGTAFLTQLLGQSNQHLISHSPANELIEAGKTAYEQYRLNGFENPIVNKCLEALVKSTRNMALYEAFTHEKKYIETNSRVTFLAPALRQAYPYAKFVHVHRHPADFIRSGMRRNWYRNKDIHEKGRIQPLSETTEIEWTSASQVAKIAWLWSETNRYIIDFLSELPEKSIFNLGFNPPSTQTLKALCQYCNVETTEQRIRSVQHIPINRQTVGKFPQYPLWDIKDKQLMFDLCNTTASSLGYQLERP